MDLTGLTTNTTSLGAVGQASQQDELGKDAFMDLLVQQMKNQDPMNPQSNDQFIAQLASFSSLEQMQNMNDNLLTMAILQDNNALMSQLTTSASLIGKDVSWTDPSTGISQSGVVGSIKVQDGLSYLDVDGATVALGSITEVSDTTPEIQ